MSRWLRDFRLIPIVLVTIVCLFALKAIGIIFDGGYTLGQRLTRSDGSTITVTTVSAPSPSVTLSSPTKPLNPAAQQTSRSWMQEMFNYPDITGSVASAPPRDPIITGSAAAPKPAPPADAKPGAAPAPGAQAQAPAQGTEAPPPSGTQIPLDAPRPISAAERAILERLQERRQELEARARELDLRESLLKAAEKRLETKQTEQKESDARGGGSAQRKDEAEAARFKGVVTMYETMKPKDAAKIFDRLDIKVLMEVASQIKPQTMSAILAQMSPEAAERLTVELTTRGADKGPNPANLPKIEGRPGG